jgi:NAD(P)H dehydrogenase (quinone)
MLAGMIAEGARAEGAEATGLNVAEMGDSGWSVLAAADAIVFGSPTFMGGIAAGFKAFMDATSKSWDTRPWGDKIAAGFTIGSRFSGDKLATLQGLSIFAAQHAMVWVGQDIVGKRGLPDGPRSTNGDGSWLGLMATSSPDKTQMILPEDAETARAFGARIARATARWNS